MTKFMEALEAAVIEYVHDTYTYVAVVRCGSEGSKPMEEEDCGKVREDPMIRTYTNCVGDSGNTSCSYFMGHVGRNVVLCGYSR
jgi:hypothetical protein